MDIILPHVTGYNFGVGIEKLSGDIKGSVVKNDKISKVLYTQGNTQSFTVTRIRSSKELEQQLGISADASLGCASFGAGVSARFSYLRDVKVQSTSLFLSIACTVRLADLSIDSPTLTDNAGQMVDNHAVFEQRYGNMFARACKRGGVFVAILQINTSSEEDSSTIESELKGTYGLFSADAKEKFKQVLIQTNSSLYCNIYCEGGPSIRIDDPNDPAKLLGLANDWMKGIQSDPENSGVPYEWTFSPITIAEGPLPPNSADLEHAQDVLKFCERERTNLFDQLNLLTMLLNHSDRFDWSQSKVSISDIQEASRKTQTDFDTIADCASAAINNPTKALMPADFAAASNMHGTYPSAIMPSPLPKLKVVPASAASASNGPLLIRDPGFYHPR